MIKGFLGNDNWLKKLVDALTNRVGTTESNVSALTGRMGTTEGNVSSLTGRVSTTENNISSLTGRVGAVERNMVDGYIFAQSTDVVAVRDRLGLRRTELCGGVDANNNFLHTCQFDENNNDTDLVQIVFDGNDFYFNGRRKGGAIVSKSLSHTHDDRYYLKNEVNVRIDAANAAIAAIPVLKTKTISGVTNGSTVDTGISTNNQIVSMYQVKQGGNSADGYLNTLYVCQMGLNETTWKIGAASSSSGGMTPSTSGSCTVKIWYI